MDFRFCLNFASPSRAIVVLISLLFAIVLTYLIQPHLDNLAGRCYHGFTVIQSNFQAFMQKAEKLFVSPPYSFFDFSASISCKTTSTSSEFFSFTPSGTLNVVSLEMVSNNAFCSCSKSEISKTFKNNSSS